MEVLLIAEKPSVANRLAAALGGATPKPQKGAGRVSYYKVAHGEDTLYIAAAAGHLFTIRQTEKNSGYPVLGVEWAPSYQVGRKSEYTKDYLDLLQKLGKDCDMLVNACDFDTEGTVIGTNIIKYITGGQLSNARRMKFSTTTNEDLLQSYSAMEQPDMLNYYAGETRHMLDWLWGINLSRALTFAVSGRTFSANMLSIGRVQGPTLAILAKREKEIAKFVPKPFWRLTAVIAGAEFLNNRGNIFDKATAEAALNDSRAGIGSAKIDLVEAREQEVEPYPPFDLTTLQVEASRALSFDPSFTLSLAQSLYERAYISYPRTSSQKLPQSLGLPKIIAGLAKAPQYAEMARSLIGAKRYRPREGQKTDEAHPAIFPTGLVPSGLQEQEVRLYDLIARRFLACFAESALVSRVKITAAIGSEKYSTNGMTISKQGWLSFYTYARMDEKVLPKLLPGEAVKVDSLDMREMKTQPPNRYTKAGLISELEKRGLGTKATRAQVIDTLFRRKYVDGASISVTEFGMSVYDVMAKNCEMIVDEDTTRKLEEDMERISKGAATEDEVIKEGKTMLLQALEQFDKNKEKIAQQIRTGLHKSSVIGACPKDGGELVIRRSRFGKQFVACANYPKCTNTYSLPQNALVVSTGRTCEICHTPFVRIVRNGRRPFEMDLDPNCPTKKEWQSRQESVQTEGQPQQANAQAAPAAPGSRPEAHKAAKATPEGHEPAPQKQKAKAKKKAKKKPKPQSKRQQVSVNVHTRTLPEA